MHNRTEKIKQSRIEPFQLSDIEEVAKLSQIYFPLSREVSPGYLQTRLEELYFKNPDCHSEITSLVSKSADGTINGFLGVTAKPFLFREREIVVANCNHLMVTETGRASLVPMLILQHFLSGPQDLSFADGSVESTRMLWKRLGGIPSGVNSLYYKVPLRPFSFAARLLSKRLTTPARIALNGLAAGVDGIGGAIRLPLFYRKKTDVGLVNLSSGLLLEGLKKISRHYTIFPVYDQRKIERLFCLLEAEKRYGTFHKVAMKDSDNNLTGWFMYYSKKGGVCEVLQAISVPGKEAELFHTITWHAYTQGGAELSGRLMPHHLMTPFTTKAISMPARMWTLAHSPYPDLLLPLQSGDAFLTRLEGDLWLL